MEKNIFIVGARGYHFPYGGWETFVDNLIDNTKDRTIKYYITNLTHEKKEKKKISYQSNVEIHNIYVPAQGFVTMFTFTIISINHFINYIKKKKMNNVILVVLGCKVGPLFLIWRPILHKLGVKVIINPDGLEWKREKWAWWIKQCFKISERYSIKYSDYCVCDSKSILEYVNKKYKKSKTLSTFIAYGAYENTKAYKTKMVKELWEKYQISSKNYYLIVGRFIPENNYETMIKEFMKSKTKKDLVIICNLEKNKFYQQLKENTNFDRDKRIKFIGSVYEQESLLYFRQHAYAYIHGHSAGGTNPSLLEALANTNINILYDVSYNKEVGENSCFYFTKEENNLKKVINKTEKLTEKEQKDYGALAKERIHKEYTWDLVVNKYSKLFETLLEK